jgi:integrase
MHAVVTRETVDYVGLIESKEDCYTYHVKTFTGWLRETGRVFDLDSVSEYFRELNRSNYTAGTIAMKRQAVKNRLRLLSDQLDPSTAYRFERAMKRLDSDPDTKGPKKQRAAIGSSSVLSESEYHTVILRARSDRQRLFVRFLWQTGCRVSELAGARVGDCKRSGAAVDIRIVGKGRKERHVRITGDLYDQIRETFRGEEYLFETSTGKPYRRSYVSDQIGKLTERVIGRRLSAHKLRHSFATRMLRNTGKLTAVSQYLGHSSTAITSDYYVHESLDDGELFGEAAL